MGQFQGVKMPKEAKPYLIGKPLVQPTGAMPVGAHSLWQSLPSPKPSFKFSCFPIPIFLHLSFLFPLLSNFSLHATFFSNNPSFYLSQDSFLFVFLDSRSNPTYFPRNCFPFSVCLYIYIYINLFGDIFLIDRFMNGYIRDLP